MLRALSGSSHWFLFYLFYFFSISYLQCQCGMWMVVTDGERTARLHSRKSIGSIDSDTEIWSLMHEAWGLEWKPLGIYPIYHMAVNFGLWLSLNVAHGSRRFFGMEPLNVRGETGYLLCHQDGATRSKECYPEIAIIQVGFSLGLGRRVNKSKTATNLFFLLFFPLSFFQEGEGGITPCVQRSCRWGRITLYMVNGRS
jgi:hypothetical protein